MHIAIIGLGKIGKNICLHLLEQGVSVVAYNRSRDDVDEVVARGAKGAFSLTELSQQLKHGHSYPTPAGEEFSEANRSLDFARDDNAPLVVILFLPAGPVVDEVLFGARANMSANESHPIREKVQAGLIDLLPTGSIIIDGGNSFYKDSHRRYALLQTKGFHYLDMGTSGGLDGARHGASLMVGGDENVYTQVKPILQKIAVKDGLGYVGPSGAGHFVKMVHNGIEYAIVQAWGEGFEMLHKSEFNLNLPEVARVYKNGSIIRSFIADLLERALKKDPHLDQYEGRVGGGQTGSWAQVEALNLGVKTPALEAALEARKASLKDPTFTGKVISALRREWGGHGEG